MPIAWFLMPYKRADESLGNRLVPTRYCAINDFMPQIRAEGGDAYEVEILSPAPGRAIVKVNASDAILTLLNEQPGFVRIPLAAMDNPLSSLTGGQRTAIRNEVLACGYTTAEVNARFPNLANATLGEVLRFLATRRRKPRYDPATDAIELDGEIQPCVSVDALDARVRGQ